MAQELKPAWLLQQLQHQQLSEGALPVVVQPVNELVSSGFHWFKVKQLVASLRS